MVTIVKKIVQQPEEIRKQRKKLISIERVINAGLSRIDASYKIRNLIRRPDGTIEFEAAVEFKPAHRERVEKLLSLLEDDDTDFVQVKFYLPRELQDKAKRRAVDMHVPASSLVAAILAENL